MEPHANLHKELDIIQSIINRMANNSFLVKGWAMTLVSGLLAFGKDVILADKSGVYYLIMMLGILIPFWWLDAYYLKQERAFRKLYDNAIRDPQAKERLQYSLNPQGIQKEIKGTTATMMTGAVSYFYIPLLLLITGGIIMKLAGKL
ncbi:MAG: hypothetical protein SFU20_11620 [Chitinophagaceae bacterium]|nr:hypothetical protein [Chitinophagaceae bacterium]